MPTARHRVMQQIGKYTVLRRLGVGGMAEVFLCRLVGLGGFEKHVVVKMIREDIVDDDFVAMFLDEARLAANLSHPNIIQVFEVDEIGGMPYFAMEYVRGATLAKLLKTLRTREQAMNFGHVAFVFASVCAGLDHAHNARDAAGRELTIVHRDISPHNIIISVDGTPKIFDFGVAKARGSAALTGADRVKGKFAYMAPEQLRAQPVDAKADVYAVGVCMYEAITGKRPFVGGTEAELYAKRLEGRFTLPSEIVPAIPIELEHMILSAMAADPTCRPTALDLHESLAVFCGAGTKHPSNAMAVSSWLKEVVGDQVEAYEGYSEANTPVPRSSSLPPGRGAVEAEPRRIGRGSRAVNAIVSVALLGLAGGAVWAFMQDDRDAPAASTKSAQSADQAARRAALEKQQHQAELDAARLETAKRAQAEHAAEQPAAAAATVESSETPTMTVEAAKSKPISAPASDLANDTLKKKTAPTKATKFIEAKRVPVKPAPTSGSAAVAKASASGSESKAGSGSGSSGSAQVATIATPTPAPATASPPSPPPARGKTAITASPAPAPATPAPPVAPSPGSLDATPTFAKLTVDGSLTTTEVQAALARTLDALRGCYRSAAKRVNQTPDVSVGISFEIDEGARASSVRVTGDSIGLSPCMKEAIGGLRTRVAPDVGTVSVSAVVRFKPTR